MNPTANNILNFNTNNVATDGQINFGHSVQKGFAYNEQLIGNQTYVGNAFNSPKTEYDYNKVWDPDFIDQLKK